jgi:hypothetical protein
MGVKVEGRHLGRVRLSSKSLEGTDPMVAPGIFRKSEIRDIGRMEFVSVFS